MENTNTAFEKQKEKAIREAKARGVLDVVQGSLNDGVSLETFEYATMLTKKHAPDLYRKLEQRRASQG